MTGRLIEALESDILLKDGIITLSELGVHLQQVIAADSGQTQLPQSGHIRGSQGGDFVLLVDTALRLPADLEDALRSNRANMRMSGVVELIDLAHNPDDELATVAQERLAAIVQNDPDERVRDAAQSYFDELDAERQAEEAQREAERIAEEARRRKERARQARDITPASMRKPRVEEPAPPASEPASTETYHAAVEVSPRTTKEEGAPRWLFAGLMLVVIALVVGAAVIIANRLGVLGNGKSASDNENDNATQQVAAVDNDNVAQQMETADETQIAPLKGSPSLWMPSKEELGLPDSLLFKGGNTLTSDEFVDSFPGYENGAETLVESSDFDHFYREYYIQEVRPCRYSVPTYVELQILQFENATGANQFFTQSDSLRPQYSIESLTSIGIDGNLQWGNLISFPRLCEENQVRPVGLNFIENNAIVQLWVRANPDNISEDDQKAYIIDLAQVVLAKLQAN